MNIDTKLVKLLISEQFPQWSHLSIEEFRSAGTDNAIFRLGSDLAVRLPRVDWAVAQVEKEVRWLPELAPHLSLPITLPIGMGLPAHNYPRRWSICKWLTGENLLTNAPADLCATAVSLAQFIQSMHRINASSAPPPGEHNFFRGVPLKDRDSRTRESIAALSAFYDANRLTSAWEKDLQAPPWREQPVWIHGDIQPGNLLASDGKLSGVIDFGGLAAGDPACDLMIAWTYFTGESREQFRTAMSVSDATWARSRGWALSVALVALPYYCNTNPVITKFSKHTIETILAELHHDS